jgi:hypothetical protein
LGSGWKRTGRELGRCEGRYEGLCHAHTGGLRGRWGRPGGLRRSRHGSRRLQFLTAAEAVFELVLIIFAAARTDDHELSSAQFIKKNFNFHSIVNALCRHYEISTRSNCWPRNT